MGVFWCSDQCVCVHVFLRAHSTFPAAERLAEAEVVTAEILHVVLFQSSADHLRCVVLAGQLGRTQTEPGGGGGGQSVISLTNAVN